MSPKRGADRPASVIGESAGRSPMGHRWNTSDIKTQSILITDFHRNPDWQQFSWFDPERLPCWKILVRHNPLNAKLCGLSKLTELENAKSLLAWCHFSIAYGDPVQDLRAHQDLSQLRRQRLQAGTAFLNRAVPILAPGV